MSDAPETRVQIRRWFVETGYVDGNGVGLWDQTEESVDVASKIAAEALRDAWEASGKLERTQWGELRLKSPYGAFRIRSVWEDANPAVLAELPEVKAMIAAAVEGAAAIPFPVWENVQRMREMDAFNDGFNACRNAIRASIPADHKAALDAYVAGKVQEAMERTAKGDNDFFALIVDGMAEADRAMKKFPQPNYVISKVAEEAGEVVKAAIHCAEGRETAENVRGEMRQLIAMLYRLWVEGDQVHGLAAIRAMIEEAKL